MLNLNLKSVCRVDKAKAMAISDLEVVQRWHQLYKGTVLSKKFLKNERLDQLESDVLKFRIGLWRKRLYDVSWFMRCLNEPIAKMANKEVGCTGRFWECKGCDFYFKNYLSFAEVG